MDLEKENKRLKKLLQKNFNKLSSDEEYEILNELKNSQLMIPIDITSNSFDFENVEIGETKTMKEPLRFIPIKIKSDTGSIILPVFTDEKEFEKSNFNVSSIIMDCEGLANMVKGIGNEIDEILVNPSSDYSMGMKKDLFLGLFVDLVENMEKIFNEHAKELTEPYTFFLRGETPFMKENCVNNIFTSDIPFNASTSPNFHKEYPYINILLIPPGNRILALGNIVNTKTNYDIILEKGIKFELVSEKENTFIWLCINKKT